MSEDFCKAFAKENQKSYENVLLLITLSICSLRGKGQRMACLETPQTKALGLSGLPGVFNSAAVNDFTEGAKFKFLSFRKCDFLSFYLTLGFQGFKQEFPQKMPMTNT